MTTQINDRRVIIPACPHCGRPATITGAEDVRSERQMFRVTVDEKATIKYRADEAGLTVGQYIRSKLL